MRHALILADRAAAGPQIRRHVELMLQADPATEFKLVVPAAPDEPHAEQEAARRLQATLSALEGIPTKVTGSVGDPQPMRAVADAVAAGRVDLILLCTPPAGSSRWLRMDLPHRLERKFDVRVDRIEPTPAGEPAVAASEVSLAGEEHQARQLRILLVEDNIHDAELTKMALEASSIDNTVRIASNGASALAFVRDVGVSPIDLIILDLKMPVLDGLGFLEQVSESVDLDETMVVILTTSSRDEDRERAHELGAGAYMVKESDFELFQHTLEGLLIDVAG